jgi:CRISPR-associated protein (TIGR03986 family)
MAQQYKKMKINSVYNFSPIVCNVFYPQWEPIISHDVPYCDGVSGSIELEIEAKSPIYIGGEEGRFPNAKGKFFIPGSSIKGEIRNVLEILSYSRLDIYNDVKYSVRDFTNRNPHYRASKFSSVLGGWLSKTIEGYKIEYCTEKPGRIGHDQLGTKFNSRYSTIGFEKSAKDKYATLHNDSKIEFVDFEIKSFQKLKDYYGRKIYGLGGNKKGYIVSTGQPSLSTSEKDGKPTGKKFEFVFWDKTDKTEEFKNQDNGEPHPIIKTFLFAYLDHDPKNQTEDWGFWKNHLKNFRRVPVFITEEKGKINHFGLSMAYKLPYDKSTGDVLNEMYKTTLGNGIDLATRIFGTINGDKLKGRVFFGHGFSKGPCKELPERNLILSSPKPTFYPFYIQQKTKAAYSIYNDGILAGRKRYPVHKKFINHDLKPSNLTSPLKPLDSGTRFTSKIVFHNLKKVELGALISSLSFHLQKDKYHSIGMAKPFGYGKCALKIKKMVIDNEVFEENILEKKVELLEVFENAMLTHDPKWLKSDSIKELMAMASEGESDDSLKYPIMTMDSENDFVKIKLARESLKPYSSISNFQLTQISIESIKESIAAQKKEENEQIAVMQKAELDKKMQLESFFYNAIGSVENLEFDKLKLMETETKAVIITLVPKKALVLFENEIIECQFVVEKGFNIDKLKNGDIINTIITQVSNSKRTINMIKMIN